MLSLYFQKSNYYSHPFSVHWYYFPLSGKRHYDRKYLIKMEGIQNSSMASHRNKSFYIFIKTETWNLLRSPSKHCKILPFYTHQKNLFLIGCHHINSHSIWKDFFVLVFARQMSEIIAINLGRRYHWVQRLQETFTFSVIYSYGDFFLFLPQGYFNFIIGK